jgi:hypothetical protein
VSDETLRELERRWRRSGSLEDETLWLQERVRAGELAEERLRLRLTLAQERWPVPQQILYAFDPCGPESWLRAAIAVAAPLAPGLAKEHPDACQPIAWLQRAEAFVLGHPAEPAPPYEFGPQAGDFEDAHHDVHWEAYEEARRAFASAQAWHAYRVLRLLRDLPTWTDVSQASGVLMTALDRVALSEALAALRTEVVPWLLGLSDPVRERVEARREDAAET